MDIEATALEEGMEIMAPNGYPVIVEAVEVDPRKPYVTFYALNGKAFRVRNDETFNVLS